MSSVGSFFSYINDARSHEPEVYGFEASVFTVTKHAVIFVRNLDTFAVKTKKVGRRLHKDSDFSTVSLKLTVSHSL